MNQYFIGWLVWIAPMLGWGQTNGEYVLGAMKNDTMRDRMGKTILWDRSSLVQVSAPHEDENANYARMVELNDGKLICVYEGRAGVAGSCADTTAFA